MKFTRAWVTYGWADGRWNAVNSLDELRSMLDRSPPRTAPDAAQAVQIFENSLPLGKT